jgi:hypothetical protein
MTPPHFCIFVIISPLNRTWPLICTILNSLYLRMICTKFYWNWPAGSGEDFFQYKHIEIWFSLLWHLPTPGDHGLYKLESTLYQKAKIHVNMSSSGSVVLEKKIFKWPHPIFAFLWLSLLWMGPGPWFEQFWIPFT